MFHRSRFGWLLVAALAVAAFAFACSDDSGTPEDGTPSDNPTSEATADDATVTPYPGEIITPDDVLTKDGSATETAELKIGWMFEASGPPEVTGFGVPTGDGVKLAVQEINDAGGFQVGDTVYTIKLVEYDTKSTEQDTIANTQALIRDDSSLVTAFVVIATLMSIDLALSLVKARWPALDPVLDSTPLVIVENGRLIGDRAAKERVDLADVLAAARERHGLERLDQIKYAVLERSGGISIIPRS